jgi:hypothetical protein
MKLRVELFDPANPPSPNEHRRLAHLALEREGQVLMSLGQLLDSSFEDGKDRTPNGGWDFLSIVLMRIKESYDILDSLDDHLRDAEVAERHPVAETPKTRKKVPA